MARESIELFLRALRERTPERVAREIVLGDTLPYVFRADAALHEDFRTRVADELGLGPRSLRVVGSAKIGFSLRPDAFGRRFSNESDIDVAVMSAPLFDEVWFALLRWHRATALPATGYLQDWVREHRTQIFKGWVLPHAISIRNLPNRSHLRPVRDLRERWLSAFRGVGRNPSLAGREVKARLYRTFDHAVIYHTSGLQQTLAERGET